jgi:hypothetical protein
MKRIIILALSVLFLTFLYSCGGSAICDRNLGCKILTVKLKSNGSIISTKTYFSKTNYYTDALLKDSVDNFITLYTTDSTSVSGADSIYHYETIKNISCKDIPNYQQNGYGCDCAK